MSEVILSAKARAIMSRYGQSYVTDAQLAKYMQLGVISEEEYAAIYVVKHSAGQNEAGPIDDTK